MRRKACPIVGAVLLACTLTSPALGEDSVKEDETLNLKVLKLYQAGKYGEALPLAQQALEVQEKVLGPEHPDVVLSVFILAKLYHATGQYAKAEPLFQRTLPLLEKGLGSEHPLVVANLNHLAGLYFDTGQYVKAGLLYQRTLAIAEKAVGPEHPDVTMNLLILAESLQGLAMLYATTGQYAKAEPLYQRSLAIAEKTLGTEHHLVATSLNNLAGLYHRTGQAAKAEPLYQRSLTIAEKALGTEHPLVATSLNNLALLYGDTDQYVKAEPLIQRSLAIREKALGSEHPDVAQSLLNLAGLYRFTGQYVKAEPLYQRSLAIAEKALGTEHPFMATSLEGLAMLAAAQHDYSKANRLLRRSLYVQDLQIQEVFAFTTEDQKLQFMEKIKWTHLIYLSLIHQHLRSDSEALRHGLEAVLRRKGVIFDAQSRMREAVQRELSDQARIEWDQLSSLRGELSRLALNKPQTLTADQYRDRLAALRHQIEQHEQRLARESAVLTKTLQQREITVAAITKILPKHAVLVEFVMVPNVRFVKGPWKPSWRYLAFTLAASGAVTLFDLGDAATLEGLVQRTLQAIKGSMEVRGVNVAPNQSERVPKPSSREPLQELFARIWAPLQPTLGKADWVILSPDEMLNLVPFAALLDGEGHALVERYRCCT